MAEGGRENRGYDLEPNEGRGEEVQMRPMRRDEAPFLREEEEEEETSFGGWSETEPLINRERARDRAWEEIRSRFPRCDPAKAGFTAGIGDDGNVVVRLDRVNARTHSLFMANGELNPKLPQTITRALGESASAIIEENEEEIRENEEEVERLREQPRTKEVVERIERREERTERLREDNQAIERERPLREQVKEIFRKQGLTILSVLTAAGAVIGVIVSNLKSGLTKMSKGIGNGLKDIGKKLAGILPGIVGSIVSFLFKTAGEAIGFLSKHAWLLILLVVTFVVEQLRSPFKTRA